MTKDEKRKHDEAAFLKELSELTLKYRLKIGGCGCCGSPFLSELEKKQKSGSYSTSEGEDLRFN